MEAIYKMNTGELGPAFISSLRDAYPDRDVEICVREAEADIHADVVLDLFNNLFY